MVILGINVGEHASSACILKDGRIAAFCQEERLSRKKWDKAFPVRAIRYCLKEAGISSAAEIDYAAVNNEILPLIKGRGGNFLKSLPRILSQKKITIEDDEPRMAKLMRTFNAPASLKREVGNPRLKIFRVRHHMGHSASAFYQSPFESSAILSLDGAGEDDSGMMAFGDGLDIRRISSIPYPHSIGILYGAVTQFLGFKENSDEWKVVGLSAYGKPAFHERFRKLIRIDKPGSFRMDLDYFDYHLNSPRWYSGKFLDLFGPPRAENGELTQRHMDIASSLQGITEEVTLSLLDYLFEKTSSPNLCLTGGVAMNSLANDKIYYRSKFKNIFIPPVADDSGLALGSALYLYHNILGGKRAVVMEEAYWGPGFSEEDIERELKAANIKYSKSENVYEASARLVADGFIIGWFQGRMEAGQRALGNRSIIADPRRPDMKEIVNRKIKFREEFRPFAPSVLEESAYEYFDYKDEQTSNPFMTMCYNVKKEKAGSIPAVTHIDGTARVQTVSKRGNGRFWSLINEFRRITGVPVVMNTSFNMKDEPIVCSPRDAVATFLKSGVDYLVMGDYIASKG
jgi:carbamoyltransferase